MKRGGLCGGSGGMAFMAASANFAACWAAAAAAFAASASAWAACNAASISSFNKNKIITKF